MIEYSCFVTPKQGEAIEDCQDALYPLPEDETKNDGNRFFCVADGATNSFFPGEWAAALVQQAAENPQRLFESEESRASWIREAHQLWISKVKTLAVVPEASAMVRNGVNFREPAAATFVGLLINDQDNGASVWKGLLQGDSCIFHLRANDVLTYGPKSSAEFDVTVAAIRSYPEKHSFRPSIEGDHLLEVGDVILLTTDALGKWLHARREAGKPAWGVILQLANKAEFETLVKRVRADAAVRMDNDDVALVVIRFGTPHKIYCQVEADAEPVNYLPAPSTHESRNNATCESTPIAGECDSRNRQLSCRLEELELEIEEERRSFAGLLGKWYTSLHALFPTNQHPALARVIGGIADARAGIKGASSRREYLKAALSWFRWCGDKERGPEFDETIDRLENELRRTESPILEADDPSSTSHNMPPKSDDNSASSAESDSAPRTESNESNLPGGAPPPPSEATT